MADSKISALAAVTDLQDTDEFVLARAGATKKIDGVDLRRAVNVYAYLADHKAAGTAGGTFTSGAWQTRDLNTEVSDVDGVVSLASNQFTLGAGTYLIRARAPGYIVARHQAKIRNITAGSDAGIGSKAHTGTSDSVVTDSFVVAVVTIAGATVFELQHRCLSTRATDGFGIASDFGVVEVYAQVEIWRYA